MTTFNGFSQQGLTFLQLGRLGRFLQLGRLMTTERDKSYKFLFIQNQPAELATWYNRKSSAVMTMQQDMNGSKI
ncbi:MAG: hypothetical protein ACR5K7_06090 [Symbiopectobacterium sp.]